MVRILRTTDFIDDLFFGDAKCAHPNHHDAARKQNQGNERIRQNDVKSPALYVQVGVTEGNGEVRSLPYIKSWCRYTQKI